jgi:hypothetical protein
MLYENVDTLNDALVKALRDSEFKGPYPSEAAFEQGVWNCVWKLMKAAYGTDASRLCLTSHKAIQPRSQAAWDAFRKEPHGADVDIFDSDHRLDIVVKHPVKGSIGIEVKRLSGTRDAEKLTQGIGQATMALEHRERTIVVIHGGAAGRDACDRVRQMAEGICRDSRLSIVVVP